MLSAEAEGFFVFGGYLFMIKAVLFDLDGTLANSIEDLADSTEKALEKLGFPGHTLAEYKYFVGDGIPKLIERALPESGRDEKTLNTCLELFMEDYRVHYHDKTKAYDGVREMLADLKKSGLKLAIISNKAQEMAEKVVTNLFGNIFDLVAGKREGYKTKPDPALTLLVIHSLGVAPAECILAGDSGMDMAAAVNAGALPVGVLWGFRTAEELRENGAEYLMSAPAEITELIGKLNG